MTTTTTRHRILITAEGGVIQGIANIPAGTAIEVRDYDGDGDREHPAWSEEHQAFVGLWEGEHNAVAGMTYTATLDVDGTEDELTIRDPEGRPMATIQFWDSDEGSRNRAHADARAIVAALNAAHGVPAGPR